MPIAKYPGCSGVVEKFEATFAAWYAAGCPTGKTLYYTADGGLSTRGTDLPFIGDESIFWHVDNFPGFFSPDKREVSKLSDAARALGLTASVSESRNGVYISFRAASTEQFRKCGLMRRVRAEHALILNVIPLAKQFYDLSLIPGITKSLQKHKNQVPNWHTGLFAYSGAYPEKEYDRDGWYNLSDGFEFRNYGYRDLKNDKELIAFIIAAYCHCQWHVTPMNLELSKLRWHLALGTRDGRRTMLTRPYLLTESTETVQQPQKLRDFF